VPAEPVRPATVVLLAGPSGSGKSRLARLLGCPRLNLDDFYHDEDEPGLPRTGRTVAAGAPPAVDWDDVGSWDSAAALAAVVELCETGATEVPVYDIATSRRTGSRRLALGTASVFVAEGLFAPDVVPACRAAGVPMEALYLDRPRTQTMLFRFTRDVSEHRKPLPVLLRRGLALWRGEPQLRARALACGCRPVSMGEAIALLAARGQPQTS
jgi:uridine kinase